MTKKIDFTLTIVLLILGAVHTILTPYFYDALNLDSLWFAGTGLSFIFLGFLNLSRLQSFEISVNIFSTIGNFLGLVWCSVLVLGVPFLEFHAFISLFVLLALTVLSVTDLKQGR